MQKTIVLLLAMGCMNMVPVHAQDGRSARKDSVTTGLSPVYKSALGNVLSNTLPVSMMKSLLDSAVHARDRKGVLRPVVSFRFGYRTHNTVVDDTTGKTETAPSYFSFQFYTNRLDSIWRLRVGEQLKPGDELFFDRIIARDEQGIQYLSSPLHFVVR